MHFGEDNPTFRVLAENLAEAFWLGSANGDEIFYVSPAFGRIWLQMGTDLLRAPRSWLDAIHPDDRRRIEHSFDTFLSAPGGNSHQEQFRIVRSDGSLRWIQQRIVPVVEPAGLPPHHLSIVRDITGLRQAEDALNRSNEKLLKLSQYQETTSESQRTRIAREIHDELGQALTIMNMDLHWLLKHCSPDARIHEKLQDMQELVGRTAKAVQDITLSLRPANLGAFGLEGALNWYIDRFSQRNEDLTCRQSIRLGNVKVNHDSSLALYRIVQETLTNVSRHACAKSVAIDIFHEGGFIFLTIEDDGVGISKQDLQRSDAWGLIGMRERVDSLRGKFDIRSTGGGTRVAVSLPLAEAGMHDDVTRRELIE